MVFPTDNTISIDMCIQGTLNMPIGGAVSGILTSYSRGGGKYECQQFICDIAGVNQGKIWIRVREGSIFKAWIVK